MSTKIALVTGISSEKQNFHLKFGKKKFAPQPKSPGDAYAWEYASGIHCVRDNVRFFSVRHRKITDWVGTDVEREESAFKKELGQKSL